MDRAYAYASGRWINVSAIQQKTKQCTLALRVANHFITAMLWGLVCFVLCMRETDSVVRLYLMG